jgi:4-hydroxy-3-methylbut-2-enyl diphosphate reductase
MKEEKKFKVILADEAGYCYGVERALKIVNQALSEVKAPLYTLGPLIHNPQVVEELQRRGLIPVGSIEEVKEGAIIIRSHGVEPSILKEASAKRLRIIDATCPFVKKAQDKAAWLSKNGYFVVIVGEKRHPEVKGILGYTNDQALLVEDAASLNLEIIKGQKKIGLVVQTTQPLDKLKEVVVKLLPYPAELHIFNTVCHATRRRQDAAKKLAKEVDVMIVIGGKNSANTTRLFHLSREINKQTYHIETASEIKDEWLSQAASVGVTAGASTPRYLIEEVVKKLEDLA